MHQSSEYGKLWPQMNFEKFLKAEAKKIKEAEQKHLKIWYNWLSEKAPGLTPHAKAFIASCNGGKKIRGALINLGYQLAGGKSGLSHDVRIYEPKEDGKTKNDHFRELLRLSKGREVKPEAVIADSWYSSLNNLKYVRDLGWNWVMELRKNRSVNRGQKLEDLTIPEVGLTVHLRGYGWITVFRFVAKSGRTDYIGTNIQNPTRKQITSLVHKRWEIEVFHRELKQTCGLEHCQSRNGRAQRNHIVLSVLTWIKSADVRRSNNFSFYQQQWDIIKQSIAHQLKCELTIA